MSFSWSLSLLNVVAVVVVVAVVAVVVAVAVIVVYFACSLRVVESQASLVSHCERIRVAHKSTRANLTTILTWLGSPNLDNQLKCKVDKRLCPCFKWVDKTVLRAEKHNSQPVLIG